MKLTKNEWLFGAGRWMRLGLELCLMGLVLGRVANAQAVTTTTVQGTVYLANGQAGAGTLIVSWPAFTTANNQAVAAGRTTVTIASNGFMTVNLAPNQGATPAGLYYTAVYQMSDGTTSTEYWVVPAAAQAALGQVRAQLMPAAQAVQAVSKAYVDQAIAELTQSLLTASGGTLSGPLYLNGDPTQALQAADKHYVDTTFNMEVPITGGSMTGALTDSSGFVGPLTGNVTGNVSGAASNVTGVVQLGNGGTGASTATGALANLGGLSAAGGTLTGALTGPNITATQLGGTYQADQFRGADFGARLQACLSTLSVSYGGTCDARNFSGTQSMGSNLTISTANATVLLPCATISTANQVIVTAGTRNVSLRGCALRGASTASGSQGGTVFLYSGTGAMVQVGDPTYAVDTMGFHLDNVVVNTTAANNATAQGLTAYRTQEMDLESLYFLGNQNQTGMTLDGTGNYTGGTFFDNAFNGFQTAVNAIGHRISNPATTDWMNASTFVRLHIDCPTSGGSQIAGTYGIDLQQGDGNTFTGGDVEGCSTALHLGPNAQNNTIVGLRNENSTNQVVADAGSAYNNWMTGGTMFTGALTDNGTRNSFLDTFHRSFNGLKGDWYGSQQDATVTNHYRIGIGVGNERGLQDRYQTDYGYRWTTGLSDATAGEQFYQILDELNNVYRLSIGQYNNGQSSTNNQTVINAAGTGAVVLNGSNNSGTGGVVFGSGGASESTVATINNAGNAQFNGTLQVGGTSTFIGTPTVKNQANAEIDATLWAGLTASQKESFIYKDWNGNSQWYMLKDASNNWALNSATGGLDSFKAYQSSNSGDTYIDASNSSGAVRVNYETGSGTAFNIYGGGSGTLYASFTGTTAIKFPGLAASSGHNCLQIDNSGYITNTGSACGSGSGGSGTVNSGTSGQIAYYTASGTAIGGMNAVPLAAGGTGAATAAGALTNLGGLSLAGGTLTGALTAPQFNGPLSGNVTGNVAGNLTGNVTGNVSGTSSNVTGTVQLGNGGTGASTAVGALANLGGVPLNGAGATGAWGISITGNAATATNVAYSGLTGTAPIWNQNTTGNAATATAASSVPYSGLTGTVPTWNQNTTSNAATATALAGTPALCPAGYASAGILPSGNATGCAAVIPLNPSGSQTIEQPAGTTLTVGGLNAGVPSAGGPFAITASWDLPKSLLQINHVGSDIGATAFQGGNEYFVQNIPAMNPNYYPIYGTTVLQLVANAYTTGDVVTRVEGTRCNSPGDCNAGMVSIVSSNGAPNGSEEGAHGGDLAVDQMSEPSGTVSSASGEPVSVMVNFTSNSGNQGDGKLLVDAQPGKVINGAQLSPAVAGGATGPATPGSSVPSDYSFPQASDTSWSLTPSTIVQLCYAGANNGGGTCASGSQPTGYIPAQANDIQPAGPVTVNVVASYSGLPSGYCNSGNLQSSNSGGSCYWPASGVMCLADVFVYETVSYTYNHSTQAITFSPKYPHINGMSAATGGACGDAVEATVDGQWFPIVGSLNSTTVLYAEYDYSLANLDNGAPLGSNSITLYSAVGAGSTGGQLCETDGTLANFSVSGNTITATASSASQIVGNQWQPFNGLTMTITTPNSTYNGNWPITVGAAASGANNSIQYTVASAPSGSAPSTGAIAYCNMTDEIAPAVMATTVYDPSTKTVDGYVGLEPNNSPFSNGDAVMQVTSPWVHFSERHFSEVTVNTPQMPGSAFNAAMNWHQYNGLVSGNTQAEAYQNTTPWSSYIGFGGTHQMPKAVFEDYGPWLNKWEMQYPPSPGGVNAGSGAVIKIDSPWPSPVGSGNKTMSVFNIYNGPYSNDTLIDEMGPFGRWDLPNAISLGSYDPAPTVLYRKSAGVMGLSKDANTSSYASDGELDAGILSATSVNTTSASVSGLTGYVYANGSSAETASVAIPGSAVSGNIAGNAAGLSGTPALPNGTTATTQAASDNSTKVQTTAGSLAQIAANAVPLNVPAWLTYLGNGSDGSNTNANGNMNGEYYYTNFTVPYGNTVTSGVTGACGGSCFGLTIHATGTCTIAGTITNGGYGASAPGRGGGTGGGSGGGSSAGASGNSDSINYFVGLSGGSAGGSNGGNGGNGYQPLPTSWIRSYLNSNPSGDGVWAIGTPGQQGANSGGAAGTGGSPVTLICAAITGTDGTHTGIINTSGGAGSPPAGNSTGAGSGGGGAPVVLSSQAAVGTWPALYYAGGPGGLVNVPYATWTGGSCTSPAKATLGASAGALSGSCTVVQAGSGCGTGAGTALQVLGGGGTLGTGTVTPTWSGGALASCTATAGTSSGYTATTYTTAGTGGDGAPGWYAEFSGW
jgi:hypothetical protein